MRSFTLDSYKKFVGIITNNYKSILRFDNYFLSDIPPESFVIFRHDIDRRPYRALVMAEIENSLGVCSTYYFRIKKHTFNPTIISKISQLGHEIGYHYESLSDTDGNMDKALIDFSWLNNNGTVQQTTFSDGSKIIANFSDQAFNKSDIDVAAASIKAILSNGELI